MWLFGRRRTPSKAVASVASSAAKGIRTATPAELLQMRRAKYTQQSYRMARAQFMAHRDKVAAMQRRLEHMQRMEAAARRR